VIKRLFALLAVFLFLSAAVWAQNPVRVVSVEYEVDGRTMVSQLAMRTGLAEGSEFRSEADFEAAATKIRQKLLNERVLETVDVAWTYGQLEADGFIPVFVQIKVKDTWNIIALPYFKYDSNSGLLLSVRGRDYNFLGSMQPLRLNLNYKVDENGDVLWGSDLDFSYPLTMWDMDWNLAVGASVGYQAGFRNPSYGASASIGSSLALGPGTLDFSLSQSLSGNAIGSDGENLDDSFYLSSVLGAGYSYVLGTDSQGRSVVVRPRIGGTVNWTFGALKDDELRVGPALSAGAGLSWGSVDWVDNFRQGDSLGLDISGTWWPQTGGLSRTISAQAALYRAFEWFGLSMKGEFYYAFDGPSGQAGSALRGILNSRASTNTAFTYNFDLPIRVLRFLPATWFGKDWMRFFEFEQHWSPFIDISQGHYDDSYFLVTDGWYAGGLEIITYPLAMRSFYVRISVGWDLVSVLKMRRLTGASPRDGASIWELFLGMGLHY